MGFFCLFVFPVIFCLLVCFVIVDFLFFISIPTTFFLLSILSSSFSHPYCHSLKSPSFPYTKIHFLPSQQLIWTLVTHSLPMSSPSPPILPQPITIPPLPSTHSSPADQPTIPNPCNPYTSTLHYNNRNIPKHTQGTQKLATPTLLLPLTHPTSHLTF
jgi:hypothetical protein